MIKIAICEDEPVYAESIKKIIEKSIDGEIICFGNGENLLQTMEKSFKADIYVMDIALPGKDGYHIASFIKQKDEDALIIFITNYDTYVHEGYEIGAFRYIRKSDMAERLPSALKNAVHIVNRKLSDKYLVIGSESKGKIKKVHLNSIILFERVSRHTEFKLLNGETMNDNRSLKDILELINDSRFVIAKKGVVINVNHVVGFNGEMAELTNDIKQHITRDNIKEIKLKVMGNWR